MSELALQSNGIWKADLTSRVVRAVYYESHSRLLAIELRHGKKRLYCEAPEGAAINLVRHHAPGLLFQVAPKDAFGKPLSRYRLKGALFLRRIKRTDCADIITTVDGFCEN